MLPRSSKAKQGDGKKVTIKTMTLKSVMIEYLTDHVCAKNTDLAKLLGLRRTRVNALLEELVADGIVVAERRGRSWIYKLKS